MGIFFPDKTKEFGTTWSHAHCARSAAAADGQ